MNAVLNEHTQTVHRRESGEASLDAVCGATNTLDTEQLRTVPLERATTDDDVSKCGRCFDDGGGY